MIQQIGRIPRGSGVLKNRLIDPEATARFEVLENRYRDKLSREECHA